MSWEAWPLWAGSEEVVYHKPPVLPAAAAEELGNPQSIGHIMATD